LTSGWVSLLVTAAALSVVLATSPLYAQAAPPPPLPAEYLSHTQAGFHFGYHPSARDRARPLMERAERIRSELTEQLGRPVLANVRVRIAVHGADLERVVPAGTPLGREVISDASQGLVAISVQSISSESAILEAFRYGVAELAIQEAGGSRLPLWLRIGFSSQFSESTSLSRARALWWASLQNRLVAVEQLDERLGDPPLAGSLPLAEAADLVRFLLADRGAFQRLLARTHDGSAFDSAMAVAYQADLGTIDARWREQLAKQRAFLPLLFGTTAVWLALAIAVWVRRARRRHADRARDGAQVAAEPRQQPTDHEAPAGDEARMSKSPRKRRELPIAAKDKLEADVPKVPYNGRWHTLH
jgi:hypothetical protein